MPVTGGPDSRTTARQSLSGLFVPKISHVAVSDPQFLRRSPQQPGVKKRARIEDHVGMIGRHHVGPRQMPGTAEFDEHGRAPGRVIAAARLAYEWRNADIEGATLILDRRRDIAQPAGGQRNGRHQGDSATTAFTPGIRQLGQAPASPRTV